MGCGCCLGGGGSYVSGLYPIAVAGGSIFDDGRVVFELLNETEVPDTVRFFLTPCGSLGQTGPTVRAHCLPSSTRETRSHG
jgi:hypothetical protein